MISALVAPTTMNLPTTQTFAFWITDQSKENCLWVRIPEFLLLLRIAKKLTKNLLEIHLLWRPSKIILNVYLRFQDLRKLREFSANLCVKEFYRSFILAVSYWQFENQLCWKLPKSHYKTNPDFQLDLSFQTWSLTLSCSLLYLALVLFKT